MSRTAFSLTSYFLDTMVALLTLSLQRKISRTLATVSLARGFKLAKGWQSMMVSAKRLCCSFAYFTPELCKQKQKIFHMKIVKC